VPYHYLQQHDIDFLAAFFLAGFFLATFLAAGAFLATFFTAFFFATVTPPSKVLGEFMTGVFHPWKLAAKLACNMF